MRKIRGGRLPVADEAILGGLKSALYHLFWQAYTGAIDLRRFEQRFAVAARLRPFLRALELTGHLQIENDNAILSERGWFVCRCTL